MHLRLRSALTVKRSLLHALWLFVPLLASGRCAQAAEEVGVYEKGVARLAVAVDADFLTAHRLNEAVADLQRCFEQMTGVPLPAAGKQVLSLSAGAGLRLQATVVGMADASPLANENGTVSLVLTPTQTLEGHPLAAAGEKAVWSCTWQRAAGKLQFDLVVANQPYQGPGYGPYSFTRLETPAPDWAAGGRMELALELRRAGGQDLRGGYRVGGGEWVYTPWFDPTKAGADTREPGVSDKNGPQGWNAGWAGQWSGRTAAAVAAYGAKDRVVSVNLDHVSIRGGDQTLFSSGFQAPEGTEAGALPRWLKAPLQGGARVAGSALVLSPRTGGWNTVGVTAASAPRQGAADLVPLRLRLLPFPAGRSRYDAALVQGWQMDAAQTGVTLSAYTPLGLQNALYGLLDRWGCRWVMPGDFGECIPRRARLSVPAGITRFAPRSDFSVEPSGTGSTYARFWARNQGGWQNWLTAQHYWLYALPPEKHFAAHPEWYSLVGGKRRPLQLCTSNPDVVAEMTKVAKQYLAGGDTRVAFPMDPMDNLDFCECAKCRALDVPGYTANGVPVMTDRVLRFANAVAAGIRSEFPDRYVAFYVYASHEALPRREKPLPNVMLGITRSNNCLTHLTPTPKCPRSDFHALVRQWQKLSPNVFAYEYDPISWSGNLPSPIYLEMGRSLRTMLLGMKIRGSYSDYGVLPAGYAGTFLNRYLPLRIKVNPRQTPEQVLHDACAAFFGPAAAAMEQHYLEMARAAATPHPGQQVIGFGTTFYYRIFDPALIARAREHLNQAITAARGQNPYQQRVAMVDLSQQYLEAYLGGVWAAQAKQYDKAVAHFDRMDARLAELIARNWADANDAPARAIVMRLKPLAEHFPARLGYVTDWKILGPFDNASLTADQRAEAFEPLADATRPVPLPGGKSAPWWSYRSPSGFLNLEKAVGARKGKWALSYAFAATTYTASRAMPARLLCDSFYPYRVFVNGSEVFYRPGLNADRPDRTRIDVRLRQGVNTILFKLAQTVVNTDSYPWGLYLRVVPDDAQEVAALPERWAFRTDPGDSGLKEDWQSAARDPAAWKQIPVGQPWENTIGPYDGFAWYRAAVPLPAVLPAGKIGLRFGGVDEEAWVYVNGQPVGERSVKSTGRPVGVIWEEPFTIEIPRDVLRPGQENAIAVRVHDSAFAGGIYRGVKLVILGP